jgi:hypothetical protein
VSDAPERAEEDAAPGSSRERFYRGTITRVYYGSESGTLVSEETGREYHFKYPFVEIVAPIRRIDALREGMAVGFDLGWTSRGVRVTLIRVFD